MLDINGLKEMADKSESGKAVYNYILFRQRGIRNNAPMDLNSLVKQLHRKGYNVSKPDVHSMLTLFPDIWDVVDRGRSTKILWKMNPVHVAKLARGEQTDLHTKAKRIANRHIVNVPRLRCKVNGVEIEAGLEEFNQIFKVLGVK